MSETRRKLPLGPSPPNGEVRPTAAIRVCKRQRRPMAPQPTFDLPRSLLPKPGGGAVAKIDFDRE